MQICLTGSIVIFIMNSRKSKKRKTLTIQCAKSIAEKRMGECLSTEYNGCYAKLQWQCYYGHEWDASLNSVKNNNSWCPKCNINIGEEITRNIMNILFNTNFITSYPDWLKGLELDGYNKELEIAFEYDGKQHYHFVRYFHRTKQGFENQKERDARKDRLCEENGVILIRIPYTVKRGDIKDYICDKCNDIGIEIPNNIDIDYHEFRHIYANNEMYVKLKKSVESKEWKLISDQYISSTDKVIVKCDVGHTFKIEPRLITFDKYCHKCFKISQGGIKRTSEIVAKYGIECISDHSEYKSRQSILRFRCKKGHKYEYTSKSIYNKHNRNESVECPICNSPRETFKDLIKNLDGECLDTEYKTRKTKMRFKCSKGHIFMASYVHIQQGRWCHACKTGRLSIVDMHELAKGYGGKCLSTEYINNRTKLQWKCKRSHVFEKTSNNIKSKKVFCHICSLK
jgi:hypothetical protein